MFNVSEEKCIGCNQCVTDCPANDIIMTEEKKAKVKNEACIQCGHCVAICPKEAVSTDAFDMSEVVSLTKEDFYVAPSTLLNMIKFRRSTRQFKEQAIPKEVLHDIIEAGRYSPTGTNSQDVSYVVLTETLGDLKDTIYGILKQKGEYLLANMTPETEHLKRYAVLWTHMYDAYASDKTTHDRLFFNAPTVILITAKDTVNGALAASKMELMASCHGLGSCFCGFALIALNDQPELLEKLGIENGKKIIACMVLGYPKAFYKRTAPRKAADIKWL